MKRFRLLFSFVVLFLCPVLLFSQQRAVSGRVTDSKDNSPLVDATVSVVGKSVSTKTSPDGAFTINVPAGSTQLRVSYIGFQDQTVEITSGNMSIAMATSNETLSDVVVVGYGTARRRDLTGSVSSVKEKDFNKGVFTSPDQLIQGKAAGVLVINNTGQPGGSTTVRIRGASSIRSGNQPLFVVDGVPLSGGSARPGGSGAAFGSDGGNPLNFINPSDIAGIEILKDASATAIYGSRGANGVVLITTKRGKSGVPQIDVNASTSISNLLRKLEVLNASEYRAALKDYGQTGGDFGQDVNAFDAITRTGITQNYSVAVGGGTEMGAIVYLPGIWISKVLLKLQILRNLPLILPVILGF
jgi:iron complex outermembrane receptor protein